jgi:hypothetical protein
MDELSGIILAVVAMFAGLLLLAWAYGDFQKPTPPPPPPPAS